MAHNYTHLENFLIVQASNLGIKEGGGMPDVPKRMVDGPIDMAP